MTRYNNCLIDSLRQCLGLNSNRVAVRNDLRLAFAHASGRAKVTTVSYLDADSHWQAIVSGLFLHYLSGQSAECDILDCCVVTLCANREGHGVVLGNVHALKRLVVLNTSDLHFDPCLPL